MVCPETCEKHTSTNETTVTHGLVSANDEAKTETEIDHSGNERVGETLHCVSKKLYPFCFCNNFFDREPIFTIFGKNVAKGNGNMRSLTCLLLTREKVVSVAHVTTAGFQLLTFLHIFHLLRFAFHISFPVLYNIRHPYHTLLAHYR